MTNDVLIIAELGLNHNGDIRLAKQMIDAAATSGADAVKFQSLSAKELVAESSFSQKIDGFGMQGVNTWGDFWEKVTINEAFQQEVAGYCRTRNIEFISTPFDFENVDVLNRLNVNCFKVASGDITHIPLLNYVAAKGKRILLSTGAASLQEVSDAIKAIRETGDCEITLLHCVALYPTPPNLANLGRMAELKKQFNLPVGFSDHSEGIHLSLAAIALGAKVIEKHFTLDRNLPGPDQKMSIDPKELAELVRMGRDIAQAITYTPKMSEQEIKMHTFMRRFIVAARDIEAGEVIKLQDLKFKRAGKGLEPRLAQELVGKKAAKKISYDQAFDWSLLNV